VPTQAPFTQVCPVVQAWLQEPQWAALVWRLTHDEPHWVCGGEQVPVPTQVPPTHAVIAGQAALHTPQCAALLRRLTQVLSHSDWPAAHIAGASLGGAASAGGTPPSPGMAITPQVAISVAQVASVLGDWMQVGSRLAPQTRSRHVRTAAKRVASVPETSIPQRLKDAAQLMPVHVEKPHEAANSQIGWHEVTSS